MICGNRYGKKIIGKNIGKKLLLASSTTHTAQKMIKSAEN